MNENINKEKEFYLSLVAYGGHKATINKIREFLRYEVPEGITYCFFLEYLLLDPIRLGKPFNGLIFCPFLERMIKEQQFLPNWEEIEKNIDDSINSLKNLSLKLYPRTRELEKHFVKQFIEVNLKYGKMEIGKKIFNEWNKDGILEQKYFLYDTRNFMKEIEGIKDIKDIDTKKSKIKEITSVIYCWAKNRVISSKSSVKLNIVGIPIASNKLFYGYILIGIPYEKKNDNNGLEKILESLGGKLEEQIVNFYLPALILCHHSFYEQICLKKEKIENKMPYLFDGLDGSKDTLERNLHILWKLRKKKEKSIFNSSSHFIFKDFFWGSPATIKKIKEAFTWDTNFGQNEGKLSGSRAEQKIKTFLIVGCPGSGKETISKMIGLFSSKHTFSVPYIFNMAAIKPNWIAPPSIAGIEIQLAKYKKYSIYGIFKKVLDQEKDGWPIIILDELNSLDIDAQGVLLRILENAEIIPIGGIHSLYKKERVKKLLVIGVVNELPPQLTQEHIAKAIYQNRDFLGELLSSTLYESFRNKRRLREDLYHRFERGGYIELKNLDDRKEDIPIAFFANVPDDLKKRILNRDVFIEYDIWDLLTSDEIEWGGNIRQLQALAHKIAQEIYKKIIEKEKNRDIDVPLIKKILKEMKLTKKNELEG